MLGSSGPWVLALTNTKIHCSSSSKCLCTLWTSTALHRVWSIFAFRTVRKIHPTVSVAVCVALFSKLELTACNAFLMWWTISLLPSLPSEPMPRGSQPHGTICYMVASGFLQTVEPQSPLPVGYPANYVNCITDHPIRDANCFVVHTVCTVR